MEIINANAERDIIVMLGLVFTVMFRQLSEPQNCFVLSSVEFSIISKRRLQWNLRIQISKEVIKTAEFE